MKTFIRVIEYYYVHIVFAIAVIGLIIGLVIGITGLTTKVEAETEAVTETEPTPVETYHIEADKNVDYEAPTYHIEIEPEITHMYYNIPLSTELQNYVYYCSGRFGLDPKLVLAVMFVESGYDPNVISVTNDYGLMQVNICNHGWLSAKYGITDFLDPYSNILAGCDILAESLGRTSDIRTGLMSYNLGYDGASYLWSLGQFTSEYVERVMVVYDSLE